MLKRKQEELITGIADLIRKQLDEDFPRGSSHYESMVELYSQENSASIIIDVLRQNFEYSRFSQTDLKTVCDEFFT